MAPFISYGNFKSAWTPLNVNPKDLSGKTILITGGNDGIGFETALQLAEMKAHIIIASRNAERSASAVTEIRHKTSNQNVEYRVLDLGSIKGVKQFCKDFVKDFEKLDILINNAGSTFGNYGETKDGLERTVQINHLGPYLLTIGLLPVIYKGENPRIVNLASKCHESTSLRLPEDLHGHEDTYRAFNVYSKTKIMNILFTKELAKRLANKDIMVVAVTPGFTNTNISISSISSPAIRFLVNVFLFFIKFIFARSSSEGAKNTVFAAIDDSVKTGEFYDSCKSSKVAPQCNDSYLANSLWHFSANLAGISPKSV